MSSPAAQKHSITQRQIYLGGLLILFAVIGFFFIPPDIFLKLGLGFSALIITTLFLFNLRLGLYALLATAFFHGWDIVLGRYAWAKNIAYISSIDAPVVDFISLLLGAALVGSVLLGIQRVSWRRLKHLRTPALFYGLFCAFALLSAFQAYEHQVGSSIKYLFRSMVFVFGAFMLLPNILIDSRELFRKVLNIWFGIGVAIAVFGISSLAVVPYEGWIRVTPYRIGDFAPLGYNHNLIAEALTAIIPVGIYLAIHALIERSRHGSPFNLKNVWYVGGSLLIACASLLTLSRAGWLSFAVEMAVLAFFFRREFSDYFLRKRHMLTGAAVVFAVGLFAYMAVFLSSSTVQSSNATRWQLNEITWFYAERSPFLGYGPGMFTRILGATFDYVIEHGEVLDSHGVVQKVLLEEGFIGVALFLAFLASIFIVLVREESPVARDRALLPVMIAMVAGVVFFQLFNTSYFTSVMWLPIGVALVSIPISRERP